MPRAAHKVSDHAIQPELASPGIRWWQELFKLECCSGLDTASLGGGEPIFAVPSKTNGRFP